MFRSLDHKAHSIQRVDSAHARLACAKDDPTCDCPAEFLDPFSRASVPDCNGTGLSTPEVTPTEPFVSLMKKGLLNAVLLLEAFLDASYSYTT